jgi:hypothetical protein
MTRMMTMRSVVSQFASPRRPGPLLVGPVAALAMVLGGASAAAGLVPIPDGPANSPQVAGDPTSDTIASFPTNKTNEPTIAVNPVDGRHLIGGANDEQRQPAWRGSGVLSDGDPVIAYGPRTAPAPAPPPYRTS